MKEKKEKGIKEQNKKKKKKAEEELPFCTTAPSAEHARSDLEDDPCDDFKEGDKD